MNLGIPISWIEWVRIKTVMKNALMGKGGAYKYSIDVYDRDNGVCGLIESIDTYEY